ncbi:hypothetical protein B566_EDAN012088 [Ephemera danica]|nr:hypothetical protein B566_EDAN012088 [Ephemera danica]
MEASSSSWLETCSIVLPGWPCSWLAECSASSTSTTATAWARRRGTSGLPRVLSPSSTPSCSCSTWSSPSATKSHGPHQRTMFVHCPFCIFSLLVSFYTSVCQFLSTFRYTPLLCKYVKMSIIK